MSSNVLDRARAYLAHVPPAISGQGGHTATFKAACALVNGFGLPPAEALPLLMEWNAGCQPPWHEAELRHKLASAERAPHGKPRGHLLADGKRVPAYCPPRPAPPAEPTPRPLPDRTGFGSGTPEQVRRLATLRPYHREGLEWAHERGVLVFGSWHGFECHGLTDASGRIVELRRMDGELFPAVTGTRVDSY